MFRIGDFARMNHIPIATLRYYDECGLLKPLHTDAQSGYRYYDAEQMIILHRILAMKEAGLTLAEIHERLRGAHDTRALLELLTLKEAELRSTLLSEQERLARLHNWIIALHGEEQNKVIEVTIKKVEPILVAGLRDTIPSFDVVGESWKELNEVINACGGKQVIPCMMLYHSNGAQGPWDIEVVEPIAKAFVPTGRVRVYELPGCEQMASAIHKGPFETIGQTYAQMHEWFRHNGYRHGGLTREIYHKGDWQTDNPEEYITELQFPIEK